MSNANQIKAKFRKNYQKQLAMLNPEQRAAVDKTEGPVLVIAGPGTGKTQILAVRIGKILEETQVDAHNILCLTYTDAGSIAMRKRLVSIIGPAAHKVHIHTFHSFANQVIQDNLGYFGDFRQLEPISDLEKVDLYRDFIDALPMGHILKRLKGDMYYEAGRMANLYDMMKKENLDTQEMHTRIADYLERLKETKEYIYQRKYTNKTTGKVYQKGDLKEDNYNKEVAKFEPLKAAVDLYPAFIEKMDSIARYDYNDMILWVLKGFNENADLLAEYQERYQYFLVDEYQDTNGAQNSILEKLIDFWDEPNVFVVGDDDQAIYKFQGANLDNIRSFKTKYNPSTEVLVNNYRSNQPILDYSKVLIEHNTERIINEDPELSKELIAAGDELKNPIAPEILFFDNIVQEQTYVCDEIIRLHKDENTDLNDVAVIYRKHKQSENLVSVLEKKGIPLNIKKKIDILKDPLVDNLLNILYYISAEYENPHSQEYRLFEMMHYNFFGISAADVAKVTLHCRADDNSHWRDVIGDEKVLTEIGVTRVKEVLYLHNLIDAWISDISNVTLQTLFHNIINDGYVLQTSFKSSEKVWQLQIISTLMDFIKDESTKKPNIKLKEFLSILDKMKDNDIRMELNKVQHASAGVHFITAHSSKGQEFKHVYIIGATTKIWDKPMGSHGRYKYPDNVNEDVITNTEDERRLFYVAMTRAKSHLQILYSLQDENGKGLEASQFVEELCSVDNVDKKLQNVEPELTEEFQMHVLLKQNKKVELIDHDLIDKYLEKYVLSVTHLNKYLKCPMTFYFESILKVPSARNKFSGFGNVMHHALQFYVEGVIDKKEQGLDKLLYHFKKGMVIFKAHFTDTEFTNLSEYGRQVFEKYYEEYLKDLPTDKTYYLEEKIKEAEYNGIPIKGQLDLIEVKGSEAHAIDYKTGDYSKSDTNKKLYPPNDKDESSVGGDYWRQIVFYKLLLDSDRKRKLDMVAGTIDFVEPNKDTGKFKRAKIVVKPEHIEKVGAQIEETWENIKAHKFNTLCEEEKCYWCNFVRNDYVFSGEFEQEMENELVVDGE